ncbi:LTE1_3 [Sanghuangporus weigelae]
MANRQVPILSLFTVPSLRFHGHQLHRSMAWLKGGVTGADMPRPMMQTTTSADVANGSGSSSINNFAVEVSSLYAASFRNVMGWLGPPASPMTSSSICSFESTKTARADPRWHGLETETTEVLEEVERPQQEQQQEQQRPDSLDSLASLKAERTKNGTTALPETNGRLISETKSEPCAIPPEASSLYTRFSTTVFDVIQNYRGLPMLDALSERSRQPTIKMSLSTLDGAVPRDDPRSVIWGEAS